LFSGTGIKNTDRPIFEVGMLMSSMNENRIAKPLETGLVGYSKSAAPFQVKHIGKAGVSGG